MSNISLSVTHDSATFVNEHGIAFTAADLDVRAGDEFGVEFAGRGPYFVLHRDGAEVGRYPMRDSHGWHFSDLRTFTMPPNPFLPPDPGTVQAALKGGSTA